MTDEHHTHNENTEDNDLPNVESEVCDTRHIYNNFYETKFVTSISKFHLFFKNSFQTLRQFDKILNQIINFVERIQQFSFSSTNQY